VYNSPGMPGPTKKPKQISAIQYSAAASRNGGPGKLIALHRGRNFGAGSVILFLLGCLVMLGLLAYGVWSGYYAYRVSGPEAAAPASRAWLAAAGLIFACLLIWSFGWIRRRRQFAAIYENGLHLRAGFFRTGFWQWSELAGISSAAIQEQFLHLPLRTTYHAALFPSRGKKVHLHGSLQDMPGLISRIKYNMYPHLLPSLSEAYQTGSWVTFGPLAIQRRGMYIGKRRATSNGQPTPGGKTIPWEQVERINIQAGYLEVTPTGQRVQRLLISDIPNLELLLELIHQGAQV